MNIPFSYRVKNLYHLHLTKCVIGPHKCTCQIASKSVKRLKQNVTDDRQTIDRETALRRNVFSRRNGIQWRRLKAELSDIAYSKREHSAYSLLSQYAFDSF